MRLCVRAVVCLLLVTLGLLGCRKPVTPNIDRNLAPETWITAAPMDTLTLRGPGGEVLDPSDPRANTIPVRFRLYWAGSDRDGAVSGYYWAVTETTTTVGEGEIGLPNLPGPKPQDYRFTPRTDTTFVFTVDQLVPDRQHAFFLYAVDNQGKPDPTPARFFFRAFDRFPPRADFVDARATGRIVGRLPNGQVTAPYDTTVFLTDTLNINVPPSQFVPAGSRLDFAWRPLITLPGTYVTGYWYKLDESEWNKVDSTVTSVSYNTGLPGDAPVSTGTKVFTLRAVSQSGSAGETTRRFVMNLPPTTWWYGPDTTLFANTPPDAQGFVDGRSALVGQWSLLNVANTAMSPDSFALRPAERIPARKTFYEIWRDRLWARAEFDTVHMNSWIVLWNGGFDPDSPYDVRVDAADPALPAPLPFGLTDAGVVGSPVGFKSQMITRTDPFGSLVTGTLSLMYPVFEPASVFRNIRGGGYWGMNRSGKAYAIARAEDSHGSQDRQVTEFVSLVEQVDANPGGATPEQLQRREKVLTFYVNKNAVLLHKDASFEPDSNEAWGNTWNFNLRGYDVDNYDWNQPIEQRQLGGPTQFPSFRFKVWVTGVAQNGRDTVWVVPNGTAQYFYTVASNNVSFQVFSNPFASGPLRVWIELCDCVDCELGQGQGRCTTWSIPVNYTRTTPEDASADAFVRPGEPSTRRSD
jgi:hypothetical protein